MGDLHHKWTSADAFSMPHSLIPPPWPWAPGRSFSVQDVFIQRAHIGPFDSNIDFDIRSLRVVEDSTLEHARREATGSLNILNSALNAHVKTTGKFSIINSTVTRNHALCVHGDQCHTRMESSVVGPCQGARLLHADCNPPLPGIWRFVTWRFLGRSRKGLGGSRL